MDVLKLISLNPNDPQIYPLDYNIFSIEYLGWSITILFDRIGRIKLQELQHQIGYFKLKNQHNSTHCDTQNLTFLRVDYSIPWMGGVPKIDIGISESGNYKRIIFKNNYPEII